LFEDKKDRKDRDILVNEEDFFAIQDASRLTLDTFAALVPLTLIHEVRWSAVVVGRHVDPSCSGYMQLVPVH
jgi:hypothetical protein